MRHMPPRRHTRSPVQLQLDAERLKNHIVFTKSPYYPPRSLSQTEEALDNENEDGKSFLEKPHELHINVAEEVPWIDLLLELAMTTAFASLADNTQMLRGADTYSFVAFFALVWWIWASQVIYNMRFRQADWFHRGCAFLQLVVLSGMAAFTNNFDVLDGLSSSSSFDQAAQIELSLNNTSQLDISAQLYRSARLPILNARGISVVMFFSRLLMFSQYFVAFLYAKRFHRSALYLHLGSVFMSAILFGSAYLDIGHRPQKVNDVVKLCLWLGGVVIEIAGHYGATLLPGRARYSPEAVKNRCATLFIIVLGTGLDKITNSFRYVVATVGFGVQSVVILFSVAIIVIGEFGSYFATTGELHGTDNRLLTYFFMHFPLLATLIVLLQGVVVILAFTNLEQSVNQVRDTFLPIANQSIPGTTLDPHSFPQAMLFFKKLGISLETIVSNLNSLANTNTSLGHDEWVGSKCQLFMQTELIAISQYNAVPQPGSLLQARLDQYLATPVNTTVTNLETTKTLLQDILLSRIEPALWFMGAAGGTLILLAILMLIRQWPRDGWEWAQVSTWLFSGVGFALISLLDLHGRSSNSLGAPIVFTLSARILPIFAAMLTLQNLISTALSILARRSARRHRQASTMMTEYDYYGEYKQQAIKLYNEPDEEYDPGSFNPYLQAMKIR